MYTTLQLSCYNKIQYIILSNISLLNLNLVTYILIVRAVIHLVKPLGDFPGLEIYAKNYVIMFIYIMFNVSQIRITEEIYQGSA